VTLARGEHDAMNTDTQLAWLDAPVVTLPGLRDNAHIQNPQHSIILWTRTDDARQPSRRGPHAG
jgi:hypothetical protein